MVNARLFDFPAYQSDDEILENFKAEYLRVHGRRPRISRSGSWIIVNYTPVSPADLRAMLESLKAIPDRPDRDPGS